ncbi:MAG TPA: hypothetical protein VN453_07170, partial [Feifaniaceae bacterium]|nr:hypothetical protein [Feifaniaceae bacterium]
RHTRLGDVLERAVSKHKIETVSAAELSGADWQGRRLLFAVSCGEGEQAELSALIRRLNEVECDLSGSACTAVLDAGEDAGAHTDLLRLLLAANGAGAWILQKPCVEASRDLKNIPAMYTTARGSLYERFCALAQALTERLSAFEPAWLTTGQSEGEPAENGAERVRISLPLENAAAARDWRSALTREFVFRGMEPVEAENERAEHTFLLCENMSGLPDNKTLAVLDDPRGGGLRAAVASPRLGAELFALLALDRACLLGNYYLEPKAFTLLEGVSAQEAFAAKAEFERVKGAITEK